MPSIEDCANAHASGAHVANAQASNAHVTNAPTPPLAGALGHHSRKRQVRMPWIIACGYFIPLLLTLTITGLVLQRLISTHLWTAASEHMVHNTLLTVGINPDKLSKQQISEMLWENMGYYTPFTLVTALSDANQSARIIDVSGVVLAQNGHQVAVMPLPPRETFEEAKMLEPFTYPYAVCWVGRDASGERHFNALMPLSLNGFPNVYLQLFMPLQYADEINAKINHLFLVSALCSLLLSIIFSAFIGNYLSRPLEKLATTANKIESGDLSARTGIDCHQMEIQEVAQAFDQMADQLEQSFAVQKRFVADASHELKTPLTSISGMAEMLEDADEEERQRALTIMNREIARMSRLVQDLLFLSRAENTAQHQNRDLTCLDIYKLVHEVAASAQPAKPDKPINLGDDPRVYVKAGADNLARVFHNLLENAQKYAPEATPIEIGFVRKEGEVEVKVRDHGPGIPEKDLPRVFERFFRSDSSRNRKTGGSGLGLSIVKALTEAAGGQASIRNHPEGGLEVSIALPLTEAPKQTPES